MKHWNLTVEMCHMIVDCCGQNRTYEKFFGLTATRLCMLKREYMELFELIFVEQYETIHRLETNKLRNVGKVRIFKKIVFKSFQKTKFFENKR